MHQGVSGMIAPQTYWGLTGKIGRTAHFLMTKCEVHA